MNAEFRQLGQDDFAAAYTIARGAVEWLLGKGIQQYLWPIPEEVYRKRHETGWNYGLFVDGELAVIVTLITGYRPSEWGTHLPAESFVWMATLASSAACKGQDLGRIAVAKAEELCRQQGEKLMVLDCYYGTGFLPRYYASLGYAPLKRMYLVFPSRTIDGLLMEKAL